MIVLEAILVFTIFIAYDSSNGKFPMSERRCMDSGLEVFAADPDAFGLSTPLQGVRLVVEYMEPAIRNTTPKWDQHCCVFRTKSHGNIIVVNPSLHDQSIRRLMAFHDRYAIHVLGQSVFDPPQYPVSLDFASPVLSPQAWDHRGPRLDGYCNNCLPLWYGQHMLSINHVQRRYCPRYDHF